MAVISSQTVQAFCLRILKNGDLASKLEPLEKASAGRIQWDENRAPIHLQWPERDESIQMTRMSERLPKLNQLHDPKARMTCIQRFAHHELQAVELFAWSILTFSNIPAALVRGLLKVLQEEQRHCSMYLDRIKELGGHFGEEGLSDYFWRHIPASSGEGKDITSFLSAMGLTLEQANLDFTEMYMKGFSDAGDHQTADIIKEIHADEVGHVRLAATWIKKGLRPGETLQTAYENSVPFPLSAARAKGRRFNAQARRDAGLSDDFIKYVQDARPYKKRHKET